MPLVGSHEPSVGTAAKEIPSVMYYKLGSAGAVLQRLNLGGPWWYLSTGSNRLWGGTKHNRV